MGITFIGNPFDRYVSQDSCTGVSIECGIHSCDNVQCGILMCVSHDCNHLNCIGQMGLDNCTEVFFDEILSQFIRPAEESSFDNESNISCTGIDDSDDD